MSAIAQGTEQPTDPQIAHIAYTAGQIDIEAAKQALDKSRDPVLTHVDDDPSAAIKPRLPRASFAAIGTAVPGATPVVFDSPFRACSGGGI